MGAGLEDAEKLSHFVDSKMGSRDKAIIFEEFAEIFQQAEMDTRLVMRRDQAEKEKDRLAVVRFEIDRRLSDKPSDMKSVRKRYPRVWDSNAEVRYLVLPERPAGTEKLSEAELAALVTRDAMVGVSRVSGPREEARA